MVSLQTLPSLIWIVIIFALKKNEPIFNWGARITKLGGKTYSEEDILPNIINRWQNRNRTKKLKFTVLSIGKMTFSPRLGSCWDHVGITSRQIFSTPYAVHKSPILFTYTRCLTQLGVHIPA